MPNHMFDMYYFPHWHFFDQFGWPLPEEAQTLVFSIENMRDDFTHQMRNMTGHELCHRLSGMEHNESSIRNGDMIIIEDDGSREVIESGRYDPKDSIGTHESDIE